MPPRRIPDARARETLETPPVRLYWNDLEHVEERLKQLGAGVTVTVGEYEYDSLVEVKNATARRAIGSIELRGNDLRVRIEPTGVRVSGSSLARSGIGDSIAVFLRRRSP